MIVTCKVKGRIYTNNDTKLFLHLDNAFSGSGKHVIIANPATEHSLSFSVDRVPDSNPCIICELLEQRGEDAVYVRVTEIRFPFWEFQKTGAKRYIHRKHNVDADITIRDFHLSRKYKYTVNKNLQGITDMMINKIASNVMRQLHTYDLQKVGPKAIFYRDGPRRDNLISCLEAKFYTSSVAYWENMYNILKRATDILQKHFPHNQNTRAFCTPRDVDVASSWKELIDFMPTHAWNYRSEGKDRYSEPYYVKNGDCEDMAIAIIKNYHIFTHMKFSPGSVLFQMQEYAKMYVPFLVFCLTGGAAPGRESTSSTLIGHVCVVYVSKPEVYDHIHSDEYKERMEQDPYLEKGRAVRATLAKCLLSEGTSIVRPTVNPATTTLFSGAAGRHLIDMERSLKVPLWHKNMKDSLSLRTITEASTTFYKYFAMLFTLYFSTLRGKGDDAHIYGLNCVMRQGRGKKYSYGVPFRDFMNMSSRVSLNPQVRVSREYIEMSRESVRYQPPIPDQRLSREPGDPVLYEYDYTAPFFQNLQAQTATATATMSNATTSVGVGYGWLSDEDIHNKKMQAKITQFVARNGYSVLYDRQKLSYDTCTHLLIFLTGGQTGATAFMRPSVPIESLARWSAVRLRAFDKGRDSVRKRRECAQLFRLIRGILKQLLAHAPGLPALLTDDSVGMERVSGGTIPYTIRVRADVPPGNRAAALRFLAAYGAFGALIASAGRYGRPPAWFTAFMQGSELQI